MKPAFHLFLHQDMKIFPVRYSGDSKSFVWILRSNLPLKAYVKVLSTQVDGLKRISRLVCLLIHETDSE